MDFDYFTRQRLEGEMLLISDRQHYGETLTKSEEELMAMFHCLNTKKTTEQNIENFFELLGELIDFKKGSTP